MHLDSWHPHLCVAKEVIPPPEFLPAHPDTGFLHSRVLVSESCLPDTSATAQQGTPPSKVTRGPQDLGGTTEEFRADLCPGNPKLVDMPSTQRVKIHPEEEMPHLNNIPGGL